MRDAITRDEHTRASRAIADHIVAMPAYALARAVLLTLPFRSEWNALLVARHALASGKVVAAPRVDPPQRMLQPLRVVDLDADIEQGYHGIPEPRADRARVAFDAIDFVLTPGVAFDRTGARLGYGGGYYDRLLPLLPAAAPRVAGAFETQIVERVPVAPHDMRVHWIVTELRTIDCRHEGR
jgi:5-formyltetrahydrofolate cyclo-ligase